MKKEAEYNLEEIQRRQTIAQLHKAGTQIRKEELERIKMGAGILLARASSIYKSIKGKDSMLSRGLENIERIDAAEKEDERNQCIIHGITDFLEDISLISMVQPEVDGLVKATNDIISDLENNGVYFSFPPFKTYPGIMACKFSLEGMIGFLKGITES